MRRSLGLVAVCVSFSGAAFAQGDEFEHAVGFRLGNLGLGVEYGYRLNELLTIRGGLNGSSYSFDDTESGIAYAFDLEFDSLSVGVDVHPLRGKFRISAGILQNDSGISAVAASAQSFDIGGSTYQPSEVGTLAGRVGFDSSAPYLGIGWDWMRQKKVGLTFEMGLVDQGAPIVSLAANGTLADTPGFMADLDAERVELQDSLDDLDVYPYAMLGIAVRF